MWDALAWWGLLCGLSQLGALILFLLFLRTRNCITWAVPRWWKGGGYLVLRLSRHDPYQFKSPIVRWIASRIIHFGWVQPGDPLPWMTHYTITEEQHLAYWAKGKWAALLSLVHFDGYVKKGDY